MSTRPTKQAHCVIAGVDSNLPDNFGRSVMYGLSAGTTYITITFVGGLPFLLIAVILVTLYYSGKLLTLYSLRNVRV